MANVECPCTVSVQASSIVAFSPFPPLSLFPFHTAIPTALSHPATHHPTSHHARHCRTDGIVEDVTDGIVEDVLLGGVVDEEGGGGGRSARVLSLCIEHL